ncbi:MAG: glycosyltransferase family 39 protein [Bacteroidales bacterium]
MKNLICLFLICSVFIGCTSKAPTEENVSFYSFNGTYVSDDKCNDSILIANKYEKQAWEIFLLEKMDGNRYAIKTIENIYVCVDTSKNNCLIANKKTVSKECIFEIFLDKKYDLISIKAFNAKYVSIGKDNMLRADSEKEPFISSINIEKNKNVFFNSYFENNQLVFLINALLLIFLSILLFNFRKKINTSLILLVLGGISLRIFAAMLDPYLNIWDERFHALVAKNMMNNPFKPMLYTHPVFTYDNMSWSENHIWLHKQPLFLWQIALFFKFFGTSEFILRLPSLLMSSIMILFTYRIARLITNKKIAYYAALLFTTSFYTLELVAGKMTTDHNDVAFAFYVTASIWAWAELYHSKNRKWIVWIGIFAGLAILNKWLTGLLVYSGWGLAILLNPKDRKSIPKYLKLLYAFMVTIVVALPWQIYTLYKFPVESRFEFEYNSRHLFEAVEGHAGNFFFHFNETVNIYGLHFLILLAALILINKTLKTREYKIAFYTYIILTYLFFSIVATKMVSFTYCISVLIYIGLGGLIYWLLEVIVINKKYFPNKMYSNLFKAFILFVFCMYNLNLDEIQFNHSNYKKRGSGFRTLNKTHTLLYKKMDKLLPENNYVIFNAPKNEAVCIMFYSGFTAYDSPITIEIYKDLKKRNIRIASFDNGDLPDFIKNDTAVFIIN